MRLFLVMILLLVCKTIFAQNQFNPWQTYLDHRKTEKEWKQKIGGRTEFEAAAIQYARNFRKDSIPLIYEKEILDNDKDIEDIRIEFRGTEYTDYVIGMFAIQTLINRQIANPYGKHLATENLFIIKLAGVVYGVLVKYIDGRWTMRPGTHIPKGIPFVKRHLSKGSYVFTFTARKRY